MKKRWFASWLGVFILFLIVPSLAFASGFAINSGVGGAVGFCVSVAPGRSHLCAVDRSAVPE